MLDYSTDGLACQVQILRKVKTIEVPRRQCGNAASARDHTKRPHFVYRRAAVSGFLRARRSRIQTPAKKSPPHTNCEERREAKADEHLGNYTKCAFCLTANTLRASASVPRAAVWQALTASLGGQPPSSASPHGGTGGGQPLRRLLPPKASDSGGRRGKSGATGSARAREQERATPQASERLAPEGRREESRRGKRPPKRTARDRAKRTPTAAGSGQPRTHPRGGQRENNRACANKGERRSRERRAPASAAERGARAGEAEQPPPAMPAATSPRRAWGGQTPTPPARVVGGRVGAVNRRREFPR